jgi:stringent starvation protein B
MIDMTESKGTTSTRPYLVRALHEWCTDNGLTPYVAVQVDDSVRVPNEYVKDGEIVLNISFDATSSLKLGLDYIEFKARFAGTARDILVPLDRVIAIYARENGQGMAFPIQSNQTAKDGVSSSQPLVLSAAHPGGKPHSIEPKGKVLQLTPTDTADGSGPDDPPRPTSGARPTLKRVK